MLPIANKMYIITKTNSALRTVERFAAEVTSIEERGEFYSIGYRPSDIMYGRFGYLHVKKVGQYKSINYTFEEVI